MTKKQELKSVRVYKYICYLLCKYLNLSADTENVRLCMYAIYVLIHALNDL